MPIPLKIIIVSFVIVCIFLILTGAMTGEEIGEFLGDLISPKK